jgi:hypothetical protein
MHGQIRTLVLVMCIAGCSGSDPDAAAATADTLTRAQRDSIIGASALPGAGGVRGALQVADTAAARQSTVDSLLKY